MSQTFRRNSVDAWEHKRETYDARKRERRARASEFAALGYEPETAEFMAAPVSERRQRYA